MGKQRSKHQGWVPPPTVPHVTPPRPVGSGVPNDWSDGPAGEPYQAPAEAHYATRTSAQLAQDAAEFERAARRHDDRPGPVWRPDHEANDLLKHNSPTELVMILLMLFLVGAALAVVPWTNAIPSLEGGGKIVLTVVGLILLLVVTIIAVITRLYRKTSANMAFVRTGMGGVKVVQDGGTLVIPVVHQVIPVSMETMRLNVERRGPHALITKDNLRVDLSAEFYIKVQANADDILQAARSLGGRNVQPDAVSELVQEKLVSALRTVAATKELVELHAKRDEFASAVQEIVTHDLSSNGLTLESVTISALDQTDPSALQERNVFDAQGLRKIAQITQQAKVERNEIEQESQRQVVMKNVETRKKVLDMERDQAEFEAEQRTKVANVRAGREREVAAYKLEQDEFVARRDIEKSKQIETAEVERRLAVEQAEIAKRIAIVAKMREQETAEILKKQAVEVAERTKEVAVAEKERERAAAQAEVLTAEAEREKAKQSVVTVTVTADADREASKKLIAAQQVITENKLRHQTEADVLAYTKIKNADAEKQAAEAQYQAKLRLAEGDAQGAAKRAEGERAIKMVDVNVERERVGVEQAKVEVERQSLSNKQEFEDAALKFELEKIRIMADKEVRIAAAQALGNMLAKANMQIFGDPETMSRMSSQFMRAASYGQAADGLLTTLPPEGKAMLERIGSAVMAQLSGAEAGNGHAAEAPVATTTTPVQPGAAPTPANADVAAEAKRPKRS
ncbi:MAG: SPFH domain-containing protein [Phycisphaerae bacterium]